MNFAASRNRALDLADRLHELGPITVTRFFGGAALVRAGIQFAFVIDGLIYFRVDDLSRLDFERLGTSPFTYEGRSKPVIIASYYELPNKIADDLDELRRWAVRAIHAATAAKLTGKRGRPGRSSR